MSAKDFYQVIAAKAGFAGEYEALVEAEFAAATGAAYSPPEDGVFRVVASRTIQLFCDAPVYIETFQTSAAEVRVPSGTTGATNDAQDGRIFFFRNASSATGTLTIADQSGSLLATIDPGESTIILHGENDAWDKLALSGSSGSTGTEAFSGYTNSNSGTFTTWIDLPIDTELKKSSGFTHTNPNPDVTIGETGTYLIIAEITIDQVSGNSRSTAEMRLVVDTGGGYNEIDGTRARMYSRNNARGEQVGSVSIIRDFTAGDQIKAQAQRFSGAGSFQILADNSRLSILNLKGPKGDQGDPGPGSSVIVKEEGISLGSFTDLNFVGTPVTATDAGGGQADITVAAPTPIFGQNYAQVSSTTIITVGGTAWTQYLSLSTGSIPAGTYRIGWFYLWNGSSVSSDVEVRIQLDNAIDLMLAREEPVDTLGSGPGGTDQRFPRGGFLHSTFVSTGSHTFDLDFRSNDASDDATIIQGHLEFWRVS